MIVSLVKSLARVLIFWYAVGVLVLFLGPTRWATALYVRLQHWPFWDVPVLASSSGITHAAAVQRALLAYWTLPILFLGSAVLAAVVLICVLIGRLREIRQAHDLTPGGVYCGVTVEDYSLGQLPPVRVPLPEQDVQIALPGVERRGRHTRLVKLNASLAEVFARLTPEELSLCEELIATLMADPEHYAGAGHGVGLLAHTFNVTREVAEKCEPDFSLPLVVALAHDIGKLLTFVKDKDGEWERRGLHSRESARILAAMPSFPKLPLPEQRALLLAVKYDHAPSKMPVLSGDQEASGIALRLLAALGVADKTATAAEKDRHLEKLNPGEILWLDFKESLPNAKFVEPNTKGVTNQVNWPEGPYLYIYESAWRDEAIQRLSKELAAALDLTRRDPGKLAKYTTILTDKFRELGILVEQYTDPQGRVMHTSQVNPLWDIRSGNEAHGAKILGVIVIDAGKLWKTINRRISPRSQYQVTILGPNANQLGEVVARVGKTSVAEKKTHELEDTSKFLVKPEDLDLFGLSAAPASKEPLAPAGGDEVNQPAAAGSQITPGEPDEPPVQGDGTQPTTASISEPATDNDALDAALQLASGLAQDEKDPPEEPLVKEPVTPEPPSVSLEKAQTVPPPGPGQTEGPLELKPAPGDLREGVRLTRSEEARGVAVADEAACEKFSHLEVGDKYYPEGSPAIERAGVKAGDLYQAPSVRAPVSVPPEGATLQTRPSKQATTQHVPPTRKVSRLGPSAPPAAEIPGLGTTGAVSTGVRSAPSGLKPKRRRVS